MLLPTGQKDRSRYFFHPQRWTDKADSQCQVSLLFCHLRCNVWLKPWPRSKAQICPVAGSKTRKPLEMWNMDCSRFYITFIGLLRERVPLWKTPLTLAVVTVFAISIWHTLLFLSVCPVPPLTHTHIANISLYPASPSSLPPLSSPLCHSQGASQLRFTHM